MGRRRQGNHSLPPRMHFRHGAYWHVTFKEGRRHWFRLSSSLAEALALWAAREGKTPAAETGTTVGDAIGRYVTDALPLLKERTRADYLLAVGRLREVFGETALDVVRPTHVAQYLDRRAAKVSANRDIAVLSSIYAHAMRWGWCDHNPTRGVRRNQERARERYLTDAELARLREAAAPWLRAWMDFAYLTALRRGDMLALRWADVSDEGVSVTIAKVEGRAPARRLYLMTPALARVLAEVRRLRPRVASVFVFATRRGQPHSPSGIESAWRRLRARAGIPDATLHDIRAKALTDAKRSGGRDYAQELAGHASGDQTETYIRARETVPVRPLR